MNTVDAPWRALITALMAGLVACGSPAEQPATDSANGDASAAVSLEDLESRNIEGINVCAVLPGEVVATAVNMPLARAEGGAEGHLCSYYLSREVGPEARVDVVLATGGSFLMTRNTSENAEEVPSLGVASFTRKVTGVNQQIWVARSDGLHYQVSAYEPDMAEPVARAALETIP